MKFKIITIGKPKLSFAKEGFMEYVKRLSGRHSVDVVHLRDGVSDEKILGELNCEFSIALDENGKEFSSRELSEFLDKKSLEGIGEVCFIIGGPDGHSDKIKGNVDFVWSFGKMTLPHDLAMVVLAEALYRATTISAGHPYHRE